MLTQLSQIKNSNTYCIGAYKYITFLSMLYLACELASLVLSFKIIKVQYFFGAAASLIFPITYTWNDIITEVYGFKITKKIIWFVFVCDYLFVFLVFFAIQAPSPQLNQEESYNLVLGSLWRSLSSEMIGVLAGAFINSAIISKWKTLTHGKFFWFRSICSSAIGELIMLLISVPLALYGTLNIKEITSLILYAYSYKIIFAVIISGPANYLANMLKSKEEIDIYDYNVSYNPFKIN
ncbi:queuosine precursor transporter [Legionella lytica]|uniref:Queuosine precursor transporter n=1 Tax=Legionella lytica TaxID=96232 RepID=A0ABW8D7G3_9GAMM